MNIIQKLRSYFSKSNNPERYTEWKVVQHDVPGFTLVDGKEVIRLVDVYERYDNLNGEYEIKKIYKLPQRYTFIE